MTTVSIVLNKSHDEEIESVARARMDMNVRNGVKDKHGASKSLQLDIMGARGEMAVAVFVGIHWSGNIGDYLAADVGHLQVRTKAKDSYRLITHKADSDSDIFISVSDEHYPRMRLMGWSYGHETKAPERWEDVGNGRPAFWTRNEQLRSMDELLQPKLL